MTLAWAEAAEPDAGGVPAMGKALEDLGWARERVWRRVRPGMGGRRRAMC